MRSSKQLCLSFIGRFGYLIGMLIVYTASMVWADESSPTPPSAVFQPDEIQHGFSEYDSPPDFYEEDTSPPLYDSYSDSPTLPAFDEKPEGLFQSLVFAEDVDEDRTIRRGHIQIPLNPRETFSSSVNAVYLVFSVHKHYAPYQIIGRLFLETNRDTQPTQWLDEDIAELATEDESGYLKFFPPDGVWTPGQYRVDIYVGYMVNTVNKMGAMRFQIHSDSLPASEEAP